jgi:pimeloyl-ACP methyl ester carboxylesterase
MLSNEPIASAGQGWHVLEVGSGEPLVILHGVFGSGDNWMSIARRLEHQFRVYLPDQRNHGKSFRSEEFGYDLLAADLLEWMETRGLEAIHLLGHSMGGKAAMRFAALAPDGLKS